MASDFEISTRLYISNGKGGEQFAFGGGLIALLREIEDTGSIYRAAKNMKMAYSKAWKLINTSEERLDIALLEREGAHGSTLTKEGKKLLDVYDAVQEDVSNYAQKAVEKALKQK